MAKFLDKESLGKEEKYFYELVNKNYNKKKNIFINRIKQTYNKYQIIEISRNFIFSNEQEKEREEDKEIYKIAIINNYKELKSNIIQADQPV